MFMEMPNAESKQAVIDFIRDFSVYEEVTANDKEYLLVHAGLGKYYNPEGDWLPYVWRQEKSIIPDITGCRKGTI